MVTEVLMRQRCDQERLMTATEVARLLTISRRTVYRLVARGSLLAVRLGRVLRIKRSELDGLLANNLKKIREGNCGQ